MIVWLSIPYEVGNHFKYVKHSNEEKEVEERKRKDFLKLFRRSQSNQWDLLLSCNTSSGQIVKIELSHFFNITLFYFAFRWQKDCKNVYNYLFHLFKNWVEYVADFFLNSDNYFCYFALRKKCKLLAIVYAFCCWCRELRNQFNETYCLMKNCKGTKLRIIIT